MAPPAPRRARAAALACCILAACLAAGAAGTTPRPRGVRPELLDRYLRAGNATFRCINGSKEIAFEKVNDDFCDCPDGTDEPGRRHDVVCSM